MKGDLVMYFDEDFGFYAEDVNFEEEQMDNEWGEEGFPPDDWFHDDDRDECGFDPYLGCYTDDC